MTFWEKAEPEDFDPTVGSIYETLEDWDGAVFSMTNVQAIERVLFLASQDRSIAREKKEWNPISPWAPDWIQPNTMALIIRMNPMFYDQFQHVIRFFDYEAKNWTALVFDPFMDDDGFPEMEFEDRFYSFIHVGGFHDSNHGRVDICSSNGITLSVIAWDKSKRLAEKTEDVLWFVGRLSEKLHIPILPKLPFDECIDTLTRWRDPFVRTLARCPKWVPRGISNSGHKNAISCVLTALGKGDCPEEKEKAARWLRATMWMDELDPTWRDRVLNSKSEFPIWPEIEP